MVPCSFPRENILLLHSCASLSHKKKNELSAIFAKTRPNIDNVVIQLSSVSLCLFCFWVLLLLLKLVSLIIFLCDWQRKSLRERDSFLGFCCLLLLTSLAFSLAKLITNDLTFIRRTRSFLFSPFFCGFLEKRREEEVGWETKEGRMSTTSSSNGLLPTSMSGRHDDVEAGGSARTQDEHHEQLEHDPDDPFDLDNTKNASAASLRRWRVCLFFFFF